MSLEDRIKHTGEHLLGSLEYDPERSDRITERIVVRARQRRQRAAAGLGAGVVVVIGGLIVLSVERAPSPGPVAAAPEQPIVTLAEMVTTSVAATLTVPATTAVRSKDSVVPTSSAEPADQTVVAPISDDAPLLFTAMHDGRTQAIDLADGTAHEVTDASASGPGEESPIRRATDSSGSFRFDLSADPIDVCGQRALAVTDGTGAPVDVALPPAASDLLVSDDGSVGLLHVADCADPANVVWHLVQFAAADPTAAPIEVPDGDWPTELSADGQFAIVGDDDGVSIVALPGGELLWSTDANCGDLRADAATGFLIGTAGFAALANCEGHERLIVAELPSPPVSIPIEGCAALAVLDILDRDGSVATDNWMTVHDVTAGKAWVVSDHGVTEAIDVGAKVWWQQPEPAGA